MIPRRNITPASPSTTASAGWSSFWGKADIRRPCALVVFFGPKAAITTKSASVFLSVRRQRGGETQLYRPADPEKLMYCATITAREGLPRIQLGHLFPPPMA